MKTYFITLPDRYINAGTRDKDRQAVALMEGAFNLNYRTLTNAASQRRAIKVTAEQLGNYIARRAMSGLGNSVAELNIRDTPDDYLDATKEDTP